MIYKVITVHRNKLLEKLINLRVHEVDSFLNLLTHRLVIGLDHCDLLVKSFTLLEESLPDLVNLGGEGIENFIFGEVCDASYLLAASL